LKHKHTLRAAAIGDFSQFAKLVVSLFITIIKNKPPKKDFLVRISHLNPACGRNRNTLTTSPAEISFRRYN